MVAAVPSLSPQSPSLKRVLKPPNPTLSDPLPKKTRHLPDLSLCHSCARHVSTPLLPLPSLWRIVLLCSPCLSLLLQSLSCSYCFSPASPADSHRCSACRRRVHLRCASRYGSSPPWSFCAEPHSKDSVFTVCVDCWVPKPLAVSGIRDSGKRVSRSGDFPRRVSESGDLVKRVSKSGGLVKRVCESSEDGARVCKKGKGLELCSEGEGKVRREKKRKIGREKEKGESERSGDGSGIDDAELAIRLHRAMNSSPRISRRFLEGCSSGVSPPIAKVDNGDSLIRALKPKERFGFTYKRRGNDSRLSDSIDAASVSVSVTSSEEGSSKHELLVYRRKCKTCDECQVKEEMISENSSMVLEDQNFHMQDLLVYRRKGKRCDECEVKEEVISDDGMVLDNLICQTQDLLVYKRKCRALGEWKLKDEVIPENGMILENQSCRSQCVLVYRRKCKKDVCQENAERVPENSDFYVENKLSVDSDASQGHLECNGIQKVYRSQGVQICNGKMESLDRYLLKFRKRNVRSKEHTNTSSLILRDGSCAESGKEAIA